MSQEPLLVGAVTLSPDTNGSALIQATQQFRDRLTETQVLQFETATYEKLCRELIRVQQEQERRNEMMNLARIKSCIEGFYQLCEVIARFINVPDAFVFVWGPMEFLLLKASASSDSFDLLLEAYEKIGEQLPLLVEYDLHFSRSPHLINALEMIHSEILDFHLEAIKLFSGRSWTRFFKSMWNDFHTKFVGILSCLRRHKDIIDCRASLAQYRLYKEDVTELQVKLDENVNRDKTKKLMVVKEWLAVGEQSQLDHESFCKIRRECATTARWITQHDIMKHWIHSDIPNSSVVWMYGIPGAGKTILASAIIEECKTRRDFITCFFYCHDGDPTSSTAVGILKGLEDQLLDHCPQMLPPCYTRRSTSGEPSLKSLNQTKGLFEDFCLTIPKLFIIIDGLDECERVERSQVLEILTKVIGQRDVLDPGTIRLLIASQDHADIRRGLHSSAITKIAPKMLQISETDNEGDIKAYTKIWVDRIETKFPSFTQDMKEYLRNLTVANAKGMFLYAKMVLLDLYACTTLGELFDSIKTDNFPAGLGEGYERTLRRVKTRSGREWPKVRRVLGWLVCAKRTFTWKELHVALSIDVDRQILDYEDKRMHEHVSELCGPLILLNGDRVSLVHSTAKTYITRITKDVHEPSIECELATLCLQYLTFPCFDVDDSDDQVQRRRYVLDGSIAFQDYATAKWFHHVDAWVGQGERFLDEANDVAGQLQSILKAMDDFMTRYGDVDWANGLVDDCKAKCRVFEHLDLHDHLVGLTSHIYTFQQKGFDAQHKISIGDLSKALDRNRKALEMFPKTKPSPTAHEKETYNRFYDEESRFKCTRITCRYFSEGFKDAKARDRHVNIHERPFQCEVPDCLGAEGFVNSRDLESHKRTFHPEMSDLAEKFIADTTKRAATNHACKFCGKTFSRNFHRKNHELSHRGERPHECPECGKAFTRLNDLKRHQKIHDRK